MPTRVQLEVDFVVNRGNLRYYYYIQSAFAINSEEKDVLYYKTKVDAKT
jgi:hypothetical protein